MAGNHPFRVENLIPSRGSERLLVRPDGSLHLDGRRSLAMVESRTGSYSASNAYWDGVNWNRYDVAVAASAIYSDPVAGTFVLLTAAAGANPITWTTSSITPAMITQLASLAATYQPLDSDLTTIAGLTATTNNVIQSVSSAWASRTPAQLMATLPAADGSNQGAMSAAQFTLVAQLGTDSGWITVSYATNWSDFGAPWQVAGYKKDETGRVHLRGMAKKSVALGANDTIFTLPSGFRPTAQEYFAVNSNSVFGAVFVTSAGAVNVGVGNNAYVSLSGISFDSI